MPKIGKSFILFNLILAAGQWGAIPARAAAPDDPVTLTVIGFVGEAKLAIGTDVVLLKPGAQAFTVPPGSEVRVVSGEITFMAAGNVISAKPNDSFRFSLAKDRALVEVLEGRISVVRDGLEEALGLGDVLTWGAPGAVPAPAAPVAAPTAPVQGPEVPSAAVPPAAPEVPAALPAETTPGAPSTAPESPVPPETPAQAETPSEVPVPPEAAPETAPALPAEPAPSRFSALRLQVELHPYYSFRETYDSNIYSVPPDKPNGDIVGGGVLGAWIMNNNLGVRAVVPVAKRHKLEASYDFRALTYSRFGGANDSMDQAVGAEYSYAGRRGTAHVSNQYANTMDPAFSELVNRERRWQNATAARFDMDLSRSIYIFLDGQHAIHKYLSSSMGRILNHYEQSFGGGAGVMLGPKTKLFTSYHRTIVHYSAGRSANSKGHSVDVGVEGQLTPKLKGGASVGLHTRRADDVTGTSITEREATWQAKVDVVYAFSRRTQASAQAFRSVSETTFSTSRFYEGTGISLSVLHAWQRVSAGVNGGMEVDRFPETATVNGTTGNRRDDLYSGGAFAQMKLKDWLSTKLDFARIQRHSTFTRQFNYAVNRTGFEIRVSF